MGGDHGCGVAIDGVKLALAANDKIAELFLVGQETEIKSALNRAHCHDPRLKIVHASEVLTMDDKPVVALRKKKDCSILRAVDLVKSGQADAVISPGNTGGIYAAATIRLRTLPGVSRGAIATVIPAPDNEFVLLDSGASVECKPWYLAEFAIMGSVYAREILGVKRPRVGILSNGTEDNKGTEMTLEAFKICRKLDLNFIGNVEGHDLFANRVDVVVCDGFVGNIVLKTCESMAKGMFAWLKRELMQNSKRRLGALLAKNAFRNIKHRLDSDNYGGAPLLGLNGTVIKVHASARDQAFMNAIRVAAGSVGQNLNHAITRELAQAAPSLEEAKQAAQTESREAVISV
jgi:glycerol-3-phosphate acyltransferase PlsX